MAGNILIEFSPFDPSTQTTTTVRMSMLGVDASGTQLDGYQWLPVIRDEPEVEIRIADGGVVQEIEISAGEVSFFLGPQFDNEAWGLLAWDAAPFRMFAGELGDPFSAYRQVLEGTTTPIARDGAIATVNLVAGNALTGNLLSASYAGTGGAEGPADAKGKLKPFAIGQCDNIEPVLIDPVKWVYQYHGYGMAQGTIAVYEAALTLGPAKTSAATYAQLAALTLAPGEWADCPNAGMFRLGGEPTLKITADVRGHKDGTTYVNKLHQIVPALLKIGGVSTAKIRQTSFDALASYGWSLYQTEQATVGEIARGAMLHAAGYLIPDSTGTWRAGLYYGNKTPVELRADRSARPLVEEIEQVETTAPIYKVRVGNRRVWSPQSSSDISPALLDAIKDTAAAQAAAAAAHEAADFAQADATLALTELGKIASDGVLDRSEKAIIVREFQELAAEKAGIEARASSVSVSSSAYTSAYSALSSYLTGLAPAYTDTTQHTTIDRSVWNTRWTALYTARTALLNEIAKHADTLGGVPAVTVTTAVTNFNSRNDRLATAIPSPAFATNGSAVEHDLNTDGSANISVNWTWPGVDADIDSWEVKVYSSTAATAYTLGTNKAAETSYFASAAARQMTLYGVPADRYYTAFVQAVRVVDKDIAASGEIRSAAVKPSIASENPYRPSAAVSFSGNVTGSVGGVPVTEIAEDRTPPVQVTGLTLASKVSTGWNGEQSVTMTATWASLANVGGYNIDIRDVGSLVWSSLSAGADASTISVPVAANAGYDVRVRAYSKANVAGAWSATVSHTAARDTIAPAVPTGFTAVGNFGGATLQWTNPADLDLASVEVWSHTSNASGSATKLATTPAQAGGSGYFRATFDAAGQTRWLWLKAVDTSGNASAFSAGASATSALIEAPDLSTVPGDKITGQIDASVVPPLPGTIINTSVSVAVIPAIPGSKINSPVSESVIPELSGSILKSAISAANVPVIPATKIEAGTVLNPTIVIGSGGPSLATINTNVADLISDTVLMPSAKPAVIRERDRIIAAASALIAEAGVYGVSSTALVTARDALTSYLNGLSPALSNTTVKTTVVVATYNARFSDYYTAETNLRALVESAAKSRSDATVAAKTAAETAASDADAAADSAGASATTATTQAGVASAKATEAGNSASAASTSAGNAATSATNAGTSASAANTAKTAAETARGQAQTFASNASGSADSAAGSASTASTQAGVSASSATNAANAQRAAELATQRGGVSTFEDKGKYFFLSGSPFGTTNSLPDTSFRTVAGVGNVYFASNGGTSTITIYPKTRKVLPNIAGRSYRATVVWRAVDGNVTGRSFGLVWTETGAQANYTTGTNIVATPAMGWQTSTHDFVSQNTTHAFVSMQAELAITAGATVEVRSFNIEDVTSEAAALGSANAAATSASNASTSATNAGTSATAANTAKTAAETARGQAQTFATNASNSADSASTSASTASTQAGVAASSALAAKQTMDAAPVLPSDFRDGLDHWTQARSGDPKAIASATWFNIVNDPVLGVAAQTTAFAASGNNLMTKGVLPGGRLYEVTAKFRFPVSDGAVSMNMLASTMNADFSPLNTAANGGMTYTTTDAQTLTVLFSPGVRANATNYGVDVPWVRFGLRLNTNETDLTLAIQSITVVDVTESKAAAGSASAAADSASSASTSATAAGTSATAANTAKTAAETARGQAQTYATNASNSADSASGSASTATTQAGVATTSANSAGTSAAAALTAALPGMSGNFPDDANIWSWYADGAPSSVQNPTANSRYSLTSNSMLINLTGQASYMHLIPKAVIPAGTEARNYRMTIVARQATAPSTGTLTLRTYLRGQNQNYTIAATDGYTTPVALTGTLATYVFDFTASANFQASVASYRPFIEFSTPARNIDGGVFEISSITVKDVTSETKAAGSATAAASSAATATTKATEAETSATAANTAKTAAETARGQAQTYATNASTSADNAAGSASTATTQAGVASSSASAAVQTAASGPILPSDFSNDGTYWAVTYTGAPTRAAIGSGTSNITFPVVSGVGKVAQINAASSTLDMAALGWMPVSAGRRYRMTANHRVTSGNVTVTMFLIYLNENGAQITNSSGNLASGSSWTKQTLERTVDVPAGTVYIRPLIRVNSGGVLQVSSVIVEDITSELAAAGSATAAAGSASTASTQAGNASTSATAANTAKTAAETARGQAQTFATNASTSADNAAGSASTATTQAGLASGSATAAGNSATAASNSAATASTKATDAGTSATAADSAKTAAETARGQAQTYATNASTSADNAAGSASTASTQAGVASTSAANANNSATAALQTVANAPVMPSTFDEDGKYWSSVWTGVPARNSLVTTPNAGITFANVANAGRVATFTRQAGNVDLSPLGWMPWATGRTYRFTARVRATAGTPAMQLFAIQLGETGTQVGTPNLLRSPGTEWENIVITVTTGSAQTVYYRPLLRLLPSSPVGSAVQVLSFTCEDITAQAAAEGSATAAAGSASAASTKADQAGASATAANTAKTAAETARGQAQTFATNASTSADNAAGSASTASTQAGVASTSATNAAASAAGASLTATKLFPNDFTSNQYWTRSVGDVTVVPAEAASTLRTSSDGLPVWFSTSNPGFFGPRAVLTTQGRRYRSTIKLRVVAGTVSGYLTWFRQSAALVNTNTKGVVASGDIDTLTNQVAGDWITLRSEFVWSDANIRLMPRLYFSAWSGATVEIADFNVEDVTSEVAAAGSASAAAGSASSASTSATNAGTSATAANTAKTAAETARGQAQTFAGNASTSADNAAGSASTAATQAGLASTSATNAGNSATAAGTSASNANTSATNAGNSATAANNSAIAAASSFDASRKAVANGAVLPSDFGEAGAYWSGAWQGLPTRANLGSGNANITFPTVSGIGIVAQIAAVSGDLDIAPLGWLVNAPGKRWRVNLRARTASGTASGPLYVTGLNELGTGQGSYPSGTVSITTAWQTLTFETSADVTGAVVRPLFRRVGSASTGAVQIASLEIIDITSEKAAKGSADAAASSATTATTKASEAGTSAQTASTQASNASTSAGNASASAGQASTSANTASTKAGEAAGSASAAAASALTANTKAGEASTSATAASTSAAQASASQAAAETMSKVSASVATGGLNANAVFADWTDTYPAYWANWSGGAPVKIVGRNSPNAVQMTATASTNVGLQQAQGDAPQNAPLSGLAGISEGWFVIEIDVELVSGSLTAAGVLWRGLNASGGTVHDTSINLATELGHSGVVGKTYQVRKLVQFTSNTVTNGRVFLMANWNGFGALTAKTINVYRCSVRPASDAEIAGGRVVSLEASVTTQAGAISTLQGKTSAYWQVSANAGTNSAVISARADGAGTSSVAIAANKFIVANLNGSNPQEAMIVENGNATFTGKLRANSITATELASNSVTTAQLVSGSVTADSIASNAVTAVKIAANTITGDKIAANSITARELSIRDAQNIFPNGDLLTSSDLPAGTRVNGVADAANAYAGKAYVLACSPGASAGWQGWSASRYSCEPNEQFYIEAWFRADSGAAGGVSVQIRWDNKDAGQVGTYTLSSGGSAEVQNWTKRSATITAPAGAVYGYAQFYVTNTAGNFYIGQMRMYRRNAGNLIVDGSITTNHMAANSIAGDRIAANTLNANKIMAGSITTNLMTAGSIDASVITAGSITGDKIATNAVLANTITVGGTSLSTISTNAASGAQAATDTAQYRTPGVPTNNPSPTALSIATQANGSRNITLNWNAYSQGARKADFLMVFWRRNSTTPTVNDTSVMVNVNTSGSSYYVFEGLSPSDGMSFGIAAARRTENGVEIGTIVAHSSWTNVTSQTPNFTANINGTAAATVVSNAALGAQDPAVRINAASTTIDPGKIVISGATTLAHWRSGGDTTKIEGGSIAANSITADKLVAGAITVVSPNNLLFGAVPKSDPNQYLNMRWNPKNVSGMALGMRGNGDDWSIRGGGTVSIQQPNQTSPAANISDGQNVVDYQFYARNDAVGNWSNEISVEAGKTYQFSAYTGAHRCYGRLLIVWYNDVGGEIGAVYGDVNDAQMGGGKTLDDYKRLVTTAVAPANAASACAVIRKGNTYAGSGDSWLFLVYPMFGEVPAGTTTAMQYIPPTYTTIEGGNIRTSSIAADRLSVGSLDAITANIGTLRTQTSGQRTEITSNGVFVYDSNNTMRVRLGIW